MARDFETVTVTPNDWVELTNSDTAAIWLQPENGPIAVRRGDETKPDATAKGMRYGAGFGELNRDVDDLGPGPGSRVWGKSLSHEAVKVVVAHA